jgi:hypothetical protein
MSMTPNNQLALPGVFEFSDNCLVIKSKPTFQEFLEMGKLFKGFDTRLNVYKADYLRAARENLEPGEMAQLLTQLDFANNDWTSGTRLCALKPEQRRLDVLSQAHHDEICKITLSPEMQDVWIQRAIDSGVDAATLSANLKMWIGMKRPERWQMQGKLDIMDLQERTKPIRMVQGISQDFRGWLNDNQGEFERYDQERWGKLARLLKPMGLLFARAMVESRGGAPL